MCENKEHEFEPCKGCRGSGDVTEWTTDAYTGESESNSLPCMMCCGTGNALYFQPEEEVVENAKK